MNARLYKVGFGVVRLAPFTTIVDDSTAAIDTATEQRIREELAEVTRNRTMIVISHRLSSLKQADEILVLEHGHIVERGSHLELLTLGGRYRDLYELQIRPPAAGLEPEQPAGVTGEA